MSLFICCLRVHTCKSVCKHSSFFPRTFVERRLFKVRLFFFFWKLATRLNGKWNRSLDASFAGASMICKLCAKYFIYDQGANYWSVCSAVWGSFARWKHITTLCSGWMAWAARSWSADAVWSGCWWCYHHYTCRPGRPFTRSSCRINCFFISLRASYCSLYRRRDRRARGGRGSVIKQTFPRWRIGTGLRLRRCSNRIENQYFQHNGVCHAKSIVGKSMSLEWWSRSDVR